MTSNIDLETVKYMNLNQIIALKAVVDDVYAELTEQILKDKQEAGYNE